MKFAILAAGEGSRLAQEGIELPKPLVKICGEAMIDRLIRIFIDCGADEIVIITNNLTPLVKEHLQSVVDSGIPLRYVVKTTPSSMHSFYELKSLLGEGKFCLTTVDTIFDEKEFKEYISLFKTYDGDGMMAVTDFVDDEKPLYLSTDEDNNVTGFHDSIQSFNESECGCDGKSVCKYISGGIYCLSSRVYATLDYCMSSGLERMRNFQRQLIFDGMNLKAYPFSKILDVDHADDIQKAEGFIGRKKGIK